MIILKSASISDVFVKLYVVSKHGRQRKIKGRAHRPETDEVNLDEVFKYQLPAEDSKSQILLCARKGPLSRSRLLGEVLLAIDSLPLDSLICDWYKLIRKCHC